jgi:copper homeostasis protein
MILEIACNNLNSVATAAANGADRIELFSNIHEGGVTPSLGTMKAAAAFGLPVYAMMRPRGGHFCYTPQEVETLKWDIDSAHEAGVQGIVFGALTAQGEIDTVLCQNLLSLWGKPATFHRAFDLLGSPFTALEQLIDMGFERVLTSGGSATAVEGITLIQELVVASKGRIQILAGAGINKGNVGTFSKIAGLEGVHTTAKRMIQDSGVASGPLWESNADEIRAIKALLD